MFRCRSPTFHLSPSGLLLFRASSPGRVDSLYYGPPGAWVLHIILIGVFGVRATVALKASQLLLQGFVQRNNLQRVECCFVSSNCAALQEMSQFISRNWFESSEVMFLTSGDEPTHKREYTKYLNNSKFLCRQTQVGVRNAMTRSSQCPSQHSGEPDEDDNLSIERASNRSDKLL